MSLEALPIEVFELIAECLAYEHPPSLLNLARVNKSFHVWCRSAINLVFFHDIKISFGLHKDVARVVDSIQKKLENANSFGQVRQLILTTEREWTVSNAEWEPPTFFALRRVGLVNTYTTQYSHLREMAFNRANMFSLGMIPDPVWKPVADLILRLPALKDVIYRYPDKFPLSLLEVLRPGCRLHMQNLWIHSLEASILLPRDYALITSPFLYSVMIDCGSLDYSDAKIGRLREEGLLRILTLAPNLKEVKISRTLHREPLSPLGIMRSTLEDTHPVVLPLASLKSLALHDTGPSGLMKSTTLREWHHYIDFAKLEHLELFPALHEPAVETLIEFAMSDLGFRSLRSLKMDISPQSPSRNTAAFYESIKLFLTKLPPLSVLDLSGWQTNISIESIAMSHGPRLRRLHLARLPRFWQHLNQKDILQLGEHCPLLEELSLAVQRSKGDTKEVALYRALGTLRSLQYLDLGLDVSPAAFYRKEECLAVPPQEQSFTAIESPTDLSFDEFDNEYTELYSGGFYKLRKGHIRDVMINSVVDQDLACAIFRIISSVEIDRLQELEAIKLSVKGNGGAGSRLHELVDLVSSSWVIRRDTRDGHHGELKVEEPIRWIPDHLLHARGAYLGSELDEIFQRIWPEDGQQEPKQKQKRGVAKKFLSRGEKEPAEGERRGLWRNECHSFPLDVSS